MAKPERVLPLHNPTPELSVIVSCACGCGAINLKEECYIYSNVTGEYYADMQCMSKAEDIQFDLTDLALRKTFMNEMEAITNG